MPGSVKKNCMGLIMRLLPALLVLLSVIAGQAQERFTLSGTVTEANSNETLIGVSILVPELRTGAVTNEYGFYSLTLPEGTYEIVVSYLGFREVRQSVSFDASRRIDFQLEEEAEELEEVILTEDVERLDIRKPQMSVAALSVETIKKIPVVLGEADVIKSIILLPGVTNAGEASSGFNVRGVPWTRTSS